MNEAAIKFRLIFLVYRRGSVHSFSLFRAVMEFEKIPIFKFSQAPFFSHLTQAQLIKKKERMRPAKAQFETRHRFKLQGKDLNE